MLLAENKKRAAMIMRLLKKEYPSAQIALAYDSPFELLCATILSAQSTDVQVNRITGSLFKNYKSIDDFAHGPLDKLQSDVSSVNFYKNKAKNIRNSAIIIMERFGGKVPRSMAELITLPGVARKTANIVLSGAFGINEGIAVDTHVRRLSQRLALSINHDPVKVEQDLMPLIPKNSWAEFSYLLILHGRAICGARKPLHRQCVLYSLCPSQDI